MRDPLFERRNPYLAHAKVRREAVQTRVDELRDGDVLVENLTVWCREALRNCGSDTPAETLQLLDALSLYGTTASPEPIKEGLAALNADTDHPDRDLSAWLLGIAIVNVLVDELTAGKTPRLLLPPDFEGGSSAFDLTHAAFEESLCRRLRETNTAHTTLLSFLREEIRLISDDPGRGTYTIDRDRFQRFVLDWKSNRTLEALWHSPGEPFLVRYHSLDLVPSILAVERQAILDLMDGFRFPHPIDQVLSSFTILHDRDEISASLEAAPACSNDGKGWNGSHLAPLLLRTAEDHARQLWEAAHSGTEPGIASDEVKELLAEWYGELARVVLRRPDGQFLAAKWALAKMADERRSRRAALPNRDAEYSNRFLSEIESVELIFSALSAAGLSGRSVAEGIEFPTASIQLEVSPTRASPLPDEAENPCLRAICAMDLLESARGSPTGEHAESLLDKLDALLLHRDPAFEIEFSLATNAHDLSVSRCGSLLASAAVAPERWLRSWNALAEQRRRAQHWLQTDDADALAPSLFVLASGIAALDWMLSTPESPGVDANVLWHNLFDAARECWLTISLTHLNQRIETDLQRLFARHPRVFGKVPVGVVAESGQDLGNEGNYAAHLAEDLALLGGDDTMVARCYVSAQRNGVSAGALDMVRRHDSGRIASSLRQFVRWQALERPNRRLLHVLEQLSDLQSSQDNI